jgi:hypothetical protein
MCRAGTFVKSIASDFSPAEAMASVYTPPALVSS